MVCVPSCDINPLVKQWLTCICGCVADIKFFKKLENKTEREKGTLQLDCKASNPNNAPTTWLKDGKPIDKDDP